MSEPTAASEREHDRAPSGTTGSTPVEIEIDGTTSDPETAAIEILREARHRLSTGPSPCAADSERLLARTAWLLLDRRAWADETSASVRTALERLLPIR